MLNSAQKTWLIITALTIAGFGVFPPAKFIGDHTPHISDDELHLVELTGHFRPIFAMPSTSRVDVVRLSVLWLATIAVGAALVNVTADDPVKQGKPPIVR